MNILQINNTDFEGIIYNGHELQQALNALGINANEMVLYKRQQDKNSISIVSEEQLNWQHEYNEFQQKSSMLNMLEPFGSGIKSSEVFQNADIVHYQLIHNHVITVNEFSRMCKLKPSVWTIHDLWAFTGHCIHPLSCEGWRNGCKNCERLEDPFFALKYSKAHELWKMKEKAYKSINPDIVVASDFTLRHVKESPLTRHFTHIHKIPFGIKMEENNIDVNKIRHELGIPDNNVVISFRLNNSELKGVKYLVKALELMKSSNVTVLAVDRGDKINLDSISSKYQIIELGTQGKQGMERFYAVTDIFVMPSLAETFGLMAVEAMARGCVVMVFDNTVLPEITSAPECGVNIPFKDYTVMAQSLDRLVGSPEERRYRGEKGIQLVKQKYVYDDYVKKHIDLYEEIIDRVTNKEHDDFVIENNKMMEEENKMKREVIIDSKKSQVMFKEFEKIVGGEINKVCIFCAGKFALRTYEILRRNGIMVDLIADNNEDKWGYWNYGLTCVGKEQLYNEKDSMLVIVANKNPDAIVEELKNIGFKYVIDYYEIEKLDNNTREMFENVTYDNIADLDYSDDGVMQLMDYMNRKICDVSNYYKGKMDYLTKKVQQQKKIKAIAMYLPQFHETQENNEWWGQGYTEWTAVKRAKKLFEGHYQPHIPFEKNYYNLLDKSTMKWQTELASENGVYGFCFYHYWFKDGRRVLEKPAENLLKWTDIDMKFCFSWANESWIRTWSNVKGGNSWVADEINESRNGADERGILLEQQYGDEKDWKEHFEYLLKFFKDDRYIKLNGKPIFMIYRPELVDCMDDMLAYWKKLAVENGLPGLYILCANCEKNIWQEVDARYIQEFNYSYNIDVKPTAEAVKWDKGILTYDYDVLWRNIINRKYDLEEDVFLGACVDFDCTPRHGKKGNLTVGGSPEKFANYFEQLCKKSIRRNNEYVFINAWNEWGEGMHLEPDEKYGDAYLKAVKQAVTNANKEYKKLAMQVDGTEYINEMQVATHTKQEEVVSLQEYQRMCSREKKFVDYFNLLNNWFDMKERGQSVVDVLNQKGYNTIALYGMGKIAKHFVNEIADSNINLRYAIDRRGDGKENYGIKVYALGDNIEPVDAIIVTAVFDFKNIKTELEKKYDYLVVSLEEIIR